MEVIHGYPQRYNAGSEIYTQTISRQLSHIGHKVAVFSRIEDPYQPDFNITTEKDDFDQSIQLFSVNHARSRDRFKHSGMDEAFKAVLETVNPEIIHINHLSHLSTGIIDVAFNEKIPVVFTLHDYWLSMSSRSISTNGARRAPSLPRMLRARKQEVRCPLHVSHVERG